MLQQVIKIIYYFFLMIKEVILGKASLSEAYRYDPRRVYTLGFFMLSIALNVIFFMALRTSMDENKYHRQLVCPVIEQDTTPTKDDTELEPVIKK